MLGVCWRLIIAGTIAGVSMAAVRASILVLRPGLVFWGPMKRRGFTPRRLGLR